MYSICVLLLLGIGLVGGDLFKEEGVLVSQNGEIRVVSGLWTVAVVLHRPKCPNIDAWVSHMRESISDLLAKGQVGADDVQVWAERLSGFHRSVDESRLLHPLPGRVRERRSPLDIVASLSNSLFGIATQAEVDSLVKAIQESQGQIEALSHQRKDMISVMNQTRIYIKENRMDITVLQNATRDISARVEANLHVIGGLDRTVNQIHIRRHVDLALDRVDRAVYQFLRELDVFHRQRLQLEQGYLTKEVMPMFYLTRILNELHQRGHDTAPTVWYYQYIPITLLHETDEQLVFRSVLPGLAKEDYLHFKIQYYPLPLGDNHLRRLTGRSQVALNTVSSASFVPESCVGASPKVCTAGVERLLPTCETTLLTGRRPEGCIITILARDNATSAVYRETDHLPGIVLVAYEPTETTLRCPGNHPIIQSYKGPNLVTVGPGCVLETKDWQVRGVDRGQSNLEIPRPQYINLPGFNLTYPPVLQLDLHHELRFTKRLDVPLLSLTDVPDPFVQTGRFSLNAVPIGSSVGGSVFVILVIVSLVLTYLKCCRSKREKQNYFEPTLPVTIPVVSPIPSPQPSTTQHTNNTLVWASSLVEGIPNSPIITRSLSASTLHPYRAVTEALYGP